MGSRAFKADVDLEGKRKKAEKEREKREKKEEAALGGRKKAPVGGVRYGNVLEATQDRECFFRSGVAPREGAGQTFSCCLLEPGMNAF